MREEVIRGNINILESDEKDKSESRELIIRGLVGVNLNDVRNNGLIGEDIIKRFLNFLISLR